MKVTKNLQRGIFLDYVLSQEEIAALRYRCLSADVTDENGNQLEVRAGLKLNKTARDSGISRPEGVRIQDAEELCLEMRLGKYVELVNIGYTWYNWGFGDMYVRREGVNIPTK